MKLRDWRRRFKSCCHGFRDVLSLETVDNFVLCKLTLIELDELLLF
jgi:hypothetical protein